MTLEQGAFAVAEHAPVGSLRNPNADTTSNLNRVQRRMDEGTLRLAPNPEGEDDAGQEFDDTVPASFSPATHSGSG